MRLCVAAATKTETKTKTEIKPNHRRKASTSEQVAPDERKRQANSEARRGRRAGGQRFRWEPKRAARFSLGRPTAAPSVTCGLSSAWPLASLANATCWSQLAHLRRNWFAFSLAKRERERERETRTKLNLQLPANSEVHSRLKFFG